MFVYVHPHSFYLRIAQDFLAPTETDNNSFWSEVGVVEKQAQNGAYSYGRQESKREKVENPQRNALRGVMSCKRPQSIQKDKPRRSDD